MADHETAHEGRQPLVCVTGAMGFAGSHVCQALRENGFNVLALVRLPGGPGNAAAVGDLAEASPMLLEQLVKGADAVIHLAGKVTGVSRDSRQAELELLAANARSTANLAQAVRQAGVPRFIHLSSLAAITPNSAQTAVTDATAVPPQTAYGRSKAAAETAARLAAEPGRLVVSLRPPIIIGNGAKGKWALLERIAASALPLPLASLDARRSYLTADQLASAIMTLCRAEPDAARSGAYAVAAPETLSLPEVVRALRKGMGKPERLFPFPASIIRLAGRLPGLSGAVSAITGPLHVDASRFMAEFGWRPQATLLGDIAAIGRRYEEFRTRGAMAGRA